MIDMAVNEQEIMTDETRQMSGPDPLISVVMPAYNCAKTLAASVESVLAQTFEDWELLIIDDCSADDTLALMRQLKIQDPGRIRLFRNKTNRGVGLTRMRGVNAARGRWIAFLDSDDLWTPDKLEKQIRLADEKPEAKLLFTGSAFINAEGDPIDYTLEVPVTINRSELLKQNLVSCSSVLIDKALIGAHPMPHRMDMHEDFACWIEILGEIPCAYGVNEPLLIYRLAKSSKSGNKLKAARMNWNTYRYAGLTTGQALYNMCCYTLRGLKKYSRIRKQ